VGALQRARVHIGHLHIKPKSGHEAAKRVEQDGFSAIKGVRVRRLTSLSAHDFWHTKHAYMDRRACDSFLFHRDAGFTSSVVQRRPLHRKGAQLEMISKYAAWAVFLLLQNASFTFVSRARNSGSYALHAVAAVASNGVWIASQFVSLGIIIDAIKQWVVAAGGGHRRSSTRPSPSPARC
jgi:hypothetical protein